jgi:hypothetical protein
MNKTNQDQDQQLLEDAEKTLEGNWTGNFTIPAATLYPHQWSWDAAFIAIGNSYFNTDKAMGWFHILSSMKRKKPTFLLQISMI